MNIDRIAAQYRWIEYAAFGRRLERSRCHFLPRIAEARSALIIGDGDGRFTCSLLASNSTVLVDFVELSAPMIALAKHRIDAAGYGNRVRYRHADALALKLPSSRYDLVATHYLLDCFSTQQANILIDRIADVMQASAQWLITDFAVPRGFWRRLNAIICVRTMYLFFRVATGLKVDHLPDYIPHLCSRGFDLESSKESRWGLIRSELWRGGKER